MLGEARVKAALHDLQHRLLHQPVFHGGDAKLAHPSIRLRYFNPPHWLRPIGAIKQLPAQFRFVTPEVFRQFVDRHAVYAGRALVRSYSLQRFA